MTVLNLRRGIRYLLKKADWDYFTHMKEAYSRWKRFKFLALGEACKANSDLLQAL